MDGDARGGAGGLFEHLLQHAVEIVKTRRAPDGPNDARVGTGHTVATRENDQRDGAFPQGVGHLADATVVDEPQIGRPHIIGALVQGFEVLIVENLVPEAAQNHPGANCERLRPGVRHQSPPGSGA
jgi:hypothetical protein